MKKLFTSTKFKIFNKTRAKQSSKKKLRFKEYRRAKNTSELGVPNSSLKHKRKFEDRFQGYTRIFAPENFTLIGNPEAVIAFINRISECFDKRRKTFVVLQKVKSIDYDAIVLLLSIMVRFKANGILFNGDYPNSDEANDLLHESGFFHHLTRQFRDTDRYNVLNKDYNTIHTHAWKNVDSALGAKIIDGASETIWGENRRCQGAQRTMLELMQNTNNHAVIGKEGERHWWISVNHRKEDKKVCFSFVDYGVGIFESLANKQHGNKWHKAIDKMKDRFQYGDNSDLLKLIVNGELHRTVTGEYYRGKGLPGIAEAMKRNQISNLHIITNDVFANVANQEYKVLSNKINATFIYWELNENNISCHGVN